MPSTIGEDLTITGNVQSKGELQIDGHIHGDVRCASLVLGETSEIEGNVTAEDVVIRGRLIGSVRALRVMLQATSHVEGDLLHKDLAMEQGAYFEGKSRRSEDPLSEERVIEPDQAVAKPRPGPERAERRRDKSPTSFVRSLNGLDNI
jgi:cytoskeletal protein CcmA (bactofilin family)